MSAHINSRAITLFTATALGLVGAFLIGRLVAFENYKMLGLYAAGALALIVGLVLGRRAWTLIPITFFASGSIGALPLPFSYQDLGIIAGVGLFVLHSCFKKQHIGFRTNWVDVLIFISIGYLLSVYIRNPVGVLAFQTELVGGRPYMTLLLVFFAYLVISHMHIQSRVAKKFTLLLAFAMVIPGFLSALTELYPATGRIIFPFYTGVNVADFNMNPGSTTSDPEIQRITSLAAFARPLILVLCAYFPPVTLLIPLYFGRFVGFLVAAGMAGISGFRNVMAAIGVFMIIGSLVRRRYVDIVVIMVVGFIGITLLSVGYIAGLPVPVPVQRALSFIPMEWDARAISGADATADWRFEMWEDAWTRPGHMRSKMFGDGFGYTIQEMMIISDSIRGIGGFLNSSPYEGHLVKGSYHSGPLSTIKRVGFVGGFVILLLMIAMFKYSLRVIKRSRNTPYFVLALFIGMPMLYLPFEFFLIFGDYSNAMSDLMFSAGMLKLIENSLDQIPSSSNGSVKAFKAENLIQTDSSPILSPVRSA